MTTTRITTTLERELYDALKELNATIAYWFEREIVPYDFKAAVAQAQKAIDKADGKKMGKIEMIKHVRNTYNLSLLDAKNMVELILENAPEKEPEPSLGSILQKAVSRP